jgi:VCBS repeat protein
MNYFIYFLSLSFTMFLSCKGQTQEMFAPAPGSPISVEGGPGYVITSDVNTDGKPDIVAVTGRNGEIKIFLGDGTGRFTPAKGTPAEVGVSAHTVAEGDLNKDGKPDLVATQHDSHNITVFLGDGKGGFKPGPDSPFPAITQGKAHNHGLILIDFNNDGFLDIATSNCENASVSVFLGKGDGRFAEAPGSPFAVGKCPYPLDAADVNGDGNIDIVTPDMLGNSISILAGDGKGGFTNAAGSPISVLERPYHITIGDINGDNHPDILASHDDVNTITILLGNGKGSFTPASSSPLDMGHRSYKIILRDLNHDNKLDLIANTYPRYVSVMLGDGKGGFTHMKGSPIQVWEGPNGIAVDDLNGDKKYDIVTAQTRSNVLVVLLGK